MTPNGFKEVTGDEFKGTLYPTDVHPCPERDMTYWKTRNGQVVGLSYPGYLRPSDPKRYYLRG